MFLFYLLDTSIRARGASSNKGREGGGMARVSNRVRWHGASRGGKAVVYGMGVG